MGMKKYEIVLNESKFFLVKIIINTTYLFMIESKFGNEFLCWYWMGGHYYI